MDDLIFLFILFMIVGAGLAIFRGLDQMNRKQFSNYQSQQQLQKQCDLQKQRDELRQKELELQRLKYENKRRELDLQIEKQKHKKNKYKNTLNTQNNNEYKNNSSKSQVVNVYKVRTQGQINKERREKIQQRNIKAVSNVLNQQPKLTVAQFFRMREMVNKDWAGCYILHNEYRDMYYVGQAKKLLFRVNQHFTGHGNGDVYVDYRAGNYFSITLIKLSESGYSDLNKLEKDLIKKYDAYENGYNRTKGNK